MEQKTARRHTRHRHHHTTRRVFCCQHFRLSLLLHQSYISCHHDFHEDNHHPGSVVGSIDGRHSPWVRRAIEQVRKQQYHAVTTLWLGQHQWWGRQEENRQEGSPQKRQEGGNEERTLCVLVWKASAQLGDHGEIRYKRQKEELGGQGRRLRQAKEIKKAPCAVMTTRRKIYRHYLFPFSTLLLHFSEHGD
jgi:hypothetical protein